ncbi:hypothetical protein [Actinomadura decatromicini]|uniref:Uncharacterized protein n=1 Tax=Actinomadura decatromicini TaxID=2604572 RepID=A0A5D3FS57_9ACTN|nr:hypothetical protein [Actinomadura decatromicini]TYK50570.1 hypothetical protein FXF68_08620 [Actinomadura decatromicini]
MNGSVPETRMPHRLPSDRPVLFAWDVPLASTAGGVCGVTDNRSRAFADVQRALTAAPLGAAGKVRKVAVSMSGSHEYVELGTIATARVDASSGAVVWR